MNKRILSVLFIGLLSLGCGETDPTTDNNGTDNNGTVKNNGTTNNNGNTANNGTTPNNGGTSNNGGTTAPVNNGNPECGTEITYYGQVASDTVNGGGVPAETAFKDDAGLDAIWTLTAENSSSDEDEYVLPAEALVQGAVVIGTWSGTGANTVFWIEDKNRAMPVRVNNEGFVLTGADGVAAFDGTLKVGDQVNFTVTKMKNYAGIPQFFEISKLEVVDSGNPVVVLDRQGMDIDVADIFRNVRVQGIISGEGNSCGGSFRCYDLTHGEKTITYRTQSDFDEPGDCVTFSGVLGGFPGPLDTGFDASSLQLTAENFEWARGPFKD